eukprot:10440368-Alexandrium_andersonii.AAC.1
MAIFGRQSDGTPSPRGCKAWRFKHLQHCPANWQPLLDDPCLRRQHDRWEMDITGTHVRGLVD